MTKVKFEDVVLEKEGFLRGPFGGDLKKDIFVPKSKNTYKVYEQGVVLQRNSSLGRYYISSEYFENKMSRFEVKERDFLVSCSGVNYGAIYQLEDNIEKGIINQALLRIRIDNDKLNDSFFYYYFKCLIVKMIVGRKGDSTIPNFPALSTIKKLEFEIPDLKYQSKIGEFLKQIDTKIDLNNKINSKLESMAKLIYDYWFVQFDFPDENGKPYKSSGGKMVYNKELKREIPAGWDAIKLNTILEFEKGIEPGSKEYSEKKLNANYIKFFRVSNINGHSETYIDSSRKKYNYAKEGDVIVTFDGSVGKVGYGINGSYSSGLRKIYSPTDELKNSLIYLIFRDERIIKTIHKYSTGSIILHASKSIEHLSIPYNKKVYNNFQNIINPFYESMVINIRQNQNLNQIRDWLLPMLMNGQVTVK